MEVYEAVRKSNIDVGAKVLEKNGIEFFIRGVGFIKSRRGFGEGRHPAGERHADPGQARRDRHLGPEFRRGALDKAGVEAVGGVVLMRYGENPLHVIERVKEKIKQTGAGPAAEDARRRPRLEGQDRLLLRPHRHRQADHRHAQGGAARGGADGQRGHRHLPAASAQHDFRHRHAAAVRRRSASS